MRTLSLVSTILIFLAARLFCQIEPSLLVTVVDPSGNEVEAEVLLTDTSGIQITKENQAGGIKFYGLGIEPVTVTVGKPPCNQVTVRAIPLRWGDTVRVKVVYNIQDCLIDLPDSPNCSVVLRVFDTNGHSIREPKISVLSPRQSTATGDQFGRYFTVVPFDQVLSVEVGAAGMKASSLRVPCTRDKQLIDSFIKLRHASEE